MGRASRRVADCTVCGRTALGLVTSFDQVPGTTTAWRLAAHRRPDGTRCIPTVPTRIYEAAPTRAR